MDTVRDVADFAGEVGMAAATGDVDVGALIDKGFDVADQFVLPICGE